MGEFMASDTQLTKQEAEKKRAKGLFPRMALSKALELTEAIYRLGHGEEVRRRSVFNELKKSPDSGAARALIAASNSGYDLTTGSQTSEYLGLSENGALYVKGKNEEERYSAIYKILYSNEIFADFLQHFNDRPLPVDEVAIDYLRKTHGISEDDAKDCWSVIRSNVFDYGLVQELSGKNIMISLDTALSNISKKNKTTDPKVSSTQDKDPEQTKQEEEAISRKANPRNQEALEIIPQITFNIQVVLPENASPDVYDSIFKSIASNLLKRGNS